MIFACHDGLCPKCRSGRVGVVQTDRPRRRLKCKVCGFSWATREVNEGKGPWLADLVRELLITGELAGAEYDPYRPHLMQIAYLVENRPHLARQSTHLA